MRDQSQGDIAWGYMLGQHAGKVALEGLVRSIFKPNTTLTDALDRLCTVLNLDLAFGQHLDYIGSIVGVTRELPNGIFVPYFGYASQPAGRAYGMARYRRDGETITTAYTAGDAEYKTLIKLKILMNNARGTAPEVVAAVRSVFNNPDLPVSVRQNGTGKARIFIGKIPLPDDPIPQLLVDRVPRAAGVAFSYEYYEPFLDVNFLGMSPHPDMEFVRNSTAAFVLNTGAFSLAAAHEPRFEYNRETGVPEGLLTESATTNVSRQTNAINAWTLTNATAGANSAADPFGGNTAEVLVVATGQTEGSAQIEGVAQGNSRIVHSVYFRDAGWVQRCNSAGSRGYARFEATLRDATPAPDTTAWAEVWMDTGELKDQSRFFNPMIQRHRGINDELYRFSGEWLPATGTSTDRVITRVRIMSVGAVATGDGTVGVVVYGVNSVNKQWVPPAVINNTTSNGGTLSDVVNFPLDDASWANLQGMTAVVEFKPLGAGINGTSLLFGFRSPGGSADLCAVQFRQRGSGRPNNSMFLSALVNGNEVLQWDYTSMSDPDVNVYENVVARAAIGFSLTGAAFAVNGKVIARKSDGLMIPVLDGGDAFWNNISGTAPPMYLRRMKVIPKLLTDAELIAETSAP